MVLNVHHTQSRSRGLETFAISKITGKNVNENLEVGGSQATSSQELGKRLRMMFKVIFNRFRVILEHFKISKNRPTKMSTKILKLINMN